MSAQALLPLTITIVMRHIQCMQQVLSNAVIDVQDQQNLARHTGRRQEQLISRTLRRQRLADYLSTDAASLMFETQQHGKPYLLNHSQLAFSQSHSQSSGDPDQHMHWLMAVNQQGIALGVDIEARQRLTSIEPLARHILTPAEYLQFEKNKQPQDFLLKIWTIKEAILKACGLGIRLNLNTLETGCQFEQRGQIQHSQIGQWCYQCFEDDRSYYAIAWQGQQEMSVLFEWA